MDSHKAYQATGNETLEEQLMNPCILKTEVSHYAARQVKELRLQLGLMTSSRDHAKRLLDSCETALIGRDALNDALEAKQAKALELIKEHEMNSFCMSDNTTGSIAKMYELIKQLSAIYTEGEE